MRRPQKQMDGVTAVHDVDSVAFKTGKGSSALHQSIGGIRMLETLRGLAIV